MLKNSYWNHTGKYQNESEELEKLMPHWGRTTNSYMNLFIVASQLYYDVYNNSGCNIEDCYVDDIEKYIKPYAKELKGINFKCSLRTIVNNLMNKEKLENFLDSVMEFISDKDLSYRKYLAYFDNNNHLLSYDKKEGYYEISFGEKEEFERWINNRKNSGYKLI